MLSEAFNDKADLQRMKDHNYAMAGKLEDVGRIATNANQEHRTGNFKEREDKKKNEAMLRLLRQQELMKDIEDGFTGIKANLDEQEQNAEQLEGLIAVMNTEGLEDDRAYIKSVYGVDTQGMSDEEVVEWEINKGYEHIQKQEDLNEKYHNDMEAQQARINKLDEGSPERAAAEKEMGDIESRYRKIAQVKNLDFTEAAKNAESNIKGFKHSSGTTQQLDAETSAGIQIDTTNSAPSNKSDSLFGKSIKNEYNAAASGETQKVAVEENLEVSENALNQPSPQGLTI